MAEHVDGYVGRRADEGESAQQPPAGLILGRGQLAHVGPAGLGLDLDIQLRAALDGHVARLVDHVVGPHQRQREAAEHDPCVSAPSHLPFSLSPLALSAFAEGRGCWKSTARRSSPRRASPKSTFQRRHLPAGSLVNSFTGTPPRPWIVRASGVEAGSSRASRRVLASSTR